MIEHILAIAGVIAISRWLWRNRHAGSSYHKYMASWGRL